MCSMIKYYIKNFILMKESMFNFEKNYKLYL